VQHHGVVNSETLDLAFIMLIAFWNQTPHILTHMKSKQEDCLPCPAGGWLAAAERNRKIF
jgi:hypothetical protein